VSEDSPCGAERRQSERIRVLVPATVECRGKKYTAKLLNIVATGAMIETAAPISPHSRLSFRCGTLTQTAYGVWRIDRRVGVRFLCPLSEAQLKEQVSRTAAVRERLRRTQTTLA
jgi:hypothetical protein